MTLTYDPGGGEAFKAAISRIPGFPAAEGLPMRFMVFESNALLRLGGYLAQAGAQPSQPLAVVMDETPMRRAGADLKAQVLAVLRAAGWQPQVIALTPDTTGQVHTDFGQIRQVQAQLTPTTALLAVGSGTVTDVAKHAAYCLQQEQGGPALPFVVYQTANSVSAYTSNMAPVFVEGVKRTLPSRYPDGLVCDLETLADAPPEMTVAGVGDLLAAFNSYADWWLAGRLGLDHTYTEFAQTLMGPLDEIFLANAEAIRTRTPAGMALLAKLIALGGLAMSLSRATAPLSGFEHVVSHVLDLEAEQARRPLAQHGSQVALATLLTTAAYDRFLTTFRPGDALEDLNAWYPSAETMQARIESAFAYLDETGAVAAECWADYQLKLEQWHAQRAAFTAALLDWPAVQARLRALTQRPERAAQILRAVDAPRRFQDLTPAPSEAEVRFAFLHAPLIRKRLTLGDLLVFGPGDKEAAWHSAWDRAQWVGGLEK
ncbi:MAG: iron-containing alcohol dehydrogenase [Anaerolineales bacterium]|nr:iron-containing alcohol dehydrogenase [Anaerolineales bacterium]